MSACSSTSGPVQDASEMVAPGTTCVAYHNTSPEPFCDPGLNYFWLGPGHPLTPALVVMSSKLRWAATRTQGQ